MLWEESLETQLLTPLTHMPQAPSSELDPELLAHLELNLDSPHQSPLEAHIPLNLTPTLDSDQEEFLWESPLEPEDFPLELSPQPKVLM